MRATSVWPTQAMPKKDAKSRTALIFVAERKPSIVKALITTNAMSTIRPMKALRP